jgi:hypothetical protein
MPTWWQIAISFVVVAFMMYWLSCWLARGVGRRRGPLPRLPPRLSSYCPTSFSNTNLQELHDTIDDVAAA